LTNEQRGNLEAEDQIEKAKLRLSELEQEHQYRQKHNKDLESQAAKVREALRQKLLDHTNEFAKMQERLDRGQERNEKVLSQIGHLSLVLDDARKSEASTKERAAETEEEVESFKNEVKLALQNREVLVDKLELLNEQRSCQLDIKKFFELGCKPCKKRFMNSFRSDLGQNVVDMGNVSFISAGSATPKASFKANGEKDRCSCSLM
jgi:chromosome segregation ATPase